MIEVFCRAVRELYIPPKRSARGYISETVDIRDLPLSDINFRAQENTLDNISAESKMVGCKITGRSVWNVPLVTLRTLFKKNWGRGSGPTSPPPRLSRVNLFYRPRIATNPSPVNFHRNIVHFFEEFPTCQECETAACYTTSKVKTTELPQFISFVPLCQGNSEFNNASAKNIGLKRAWYEYLPV